MREGSPPHTCHLSYVTCHVLRDTAFLHSGEASSGGSSLLYKQLSKDLNLIRNLQSPYVLKLQLVKYLNFIFTHLI